MPEGPELHLSSLFINRICRDLVFGGKVARNPIHKCADITWDEPSYTISAESRGKELMLHLIALVDTKTSVCLKEEKKPSAHKLVKAQTRSTSVLFTFGMSGKFEFTRANELLKHSHLTFFTKTNVGDEKSAMALSFVDYRRFGRWFQDSHWSKDRGPCAIQEYDGFVKNVADNLDHSAFSRPICEIMLDQRFFSGIGNYLRAEILFRCKVAPFERASSVLRASEENGKKTESTKKSHSKCKKGKSDAPSEDEPEDETSKSSSQPCIKSEHPVNGEVNHPEIKKEQEDCHVEDNGSDSKDVKIMWNKFSKKGQEILHLCHTVPLEVVKLGSTKYSLTELYQDSDNGTQSFNDWLQCYYKDGMKNLADHNSRTIWFSGPAGPLVPKEQKSRGRKTSSKKAPKDKESTPKPKATPTSLQSDSEHSRSTRKVTKGRLTRKELKDLENSETERKQRKNKRGKNETTDLSNGHVVPASSGSVISQSESKRKRKSDIPNQPTSGATKKKRISKDVSVPKKAQRRVTRSSLVNAQ